MMEFKPHGQMTVNWIGNCLVMEFSGSVNIEGAALFKERIERAIRESSVREWFGIHQSTDQTMSTPEAYIVLEHSLLWALDNGCIGTVLIGAPMLIKSKFREICANTNAIL